MHFVARHRYQNTKCNRHETAYETQSWPAHSHGAHLTTDIPVPRHLRKETGPEKFLKARTPNLFFTCKGKTSAICISNLTNYPLRIVVNSESKNLIIQKYV